MSETHRISLVVLVFWCILFFTTLNLALAQFGIVQDIGLSVSPQNPSPNSVVTVSLEAYSMNTTGATISWFIDNSELTASKNERRISVVLGDFGEDTIVRAVITPQNGPAQSVEKVVRPSTIDLIIEADTNVPVFYRGRALPGQGSEIRVIALPFDGSGQHAEQYTYKWELNRSVLYGGPIKGKSIAEFTVPDFKNALLSVEVSSPSGLYIGKKNIFLSGTDPELYFYEVNPLRGLGRRAIGEVHALLEEEMTIRAEPYFIDTEFDAGTIDHVWRLNGTVVQNVDPDPQQLTLRTTGGTGNASVQFRAINTRQLSQFAEDSFTVVFE